MTDDEIRDESLSKMLLRFYQKTHGKAEFLKKALKAGFDEGEAQIVWYALFHLECAMET